MQTVLLLHRERRRPHDQRQLRELRRLKGDAQLDPSPRAVDAGGDAFGPRQDDEEEEQHHHAEQRPGERLKASVVEPREARR